MLWFYEDRCKAILDEDKARGLLILWLRLLPDWGRTVVKERLLSAAYSRATNMDTTQFNAQLTSTFAVFSRALRDGYNVLQSIEIIAEHAPEPTRSIMQKLLTDFNTGTELLAALSALETETQSPQFARFMDAIRTQIQVGDNLADRLDAVNRDVVAELGDDGWARNVDLDDGYDFDQHYPLN